MERLWVTMVCAPHQGAQNKSCNEVRAEPPDHVCALQSQLNPEPVMAASQSRGNHTAAHTFQRDF